MDLGGWLHSLGLERYEAAFRENDIDETVLASLTHETLKEIGVTTVGHRLKLLDAIAALRTDAGAKPPSADAASTSAAPSAPPEDRAERRQVTVMFSDLVGSTALSARMDPEDLREVISAYQKCVAETVQRFGGFVAKYMGDGVLVYFGYPQAHEDDAERAVRAGLELVQAISSLKTSAPLQTRVGIATGLVVVGDLIGSGSAHEQAVVGETPNLAARLQSIAKPNAVGSATTKFGRKPFRGAAHRNNATGRPRRRDRSADAALGTSEGGRWLRGADLGRAGYRKIARCSNDARAA
jgi:class 3 adenylate cyclase